jgi:hypothetical protein
MTETKELLRRGVGEFEPMPDAFDRVLERRDRKHRNQRVAAGVLGIAVFALAAIGLVRLFGSESAPTPGGEPDSPFLGTWVSTSDADGGTQTMIIERSDDTFDIVVTDTIAPVCSGTPATMTGTGVLDPSGALVIASPAITCDDGSDPEYLSGPPIEEVLANLTFVLDVETETVTDSLGGVWLRKGAGDPSTTEDPLANLTPLWPQTSMEEVRQAQELADAGDPDYTWQVTRDLEGQVGQSHPADAEIFGRFLEEALGWEDYLWDEAAAHPDGVDSGDVVYIRCAPGGTNPLYPDARGGGCAPTLDELRYETVKIHVAQLDRQGPSGIWVVTGWDIIEPFEQTPPPSDAEIAELLEPFLQARIDGDGAEGLAEVAEYDPFADRRVDPGIPLLYATSTGSSYERSEFEVVGGGPGWPSGRTQLEVRLFAENGDVVEQRFSLESDEAGLLRLVYDFEPFGPQGPILATTENGNAVPVEYGFLDGDVTFRATYPAQPDQENWVGGPDRFPVNGLPFHKRNLTLVLLLADPRPVGPGCEEAKAPADAEALARSLRSDSDLEATAPVTVTVAGAPALQIDVLLTPDATECPFALTNISGSGPLLVKDTPIFEDQLVRLYLLDLPHGASARVLAVVIPHADVENALELAAPIVDSIEFHAR